MILLVPIFSAVVIVSLLGLIHGSWLAAFWLGVGLVAGMSLLKLDEKWLHTWYDDPEPATPGVKWPLLTRSILFIVTYLPMALFVVTSAGSWLGSGFVIGIGLILLSELILFRQDEEAFRTRFVPHLKTPLSTEERQWVLVVFSGLLLFLIIKVLM